MKQLLATLKQLTSNKRSRPPAIMGHVVLGYPSLQDSIQLAQILSESGVALLELQLPFTDPMADGPTIMEANRVALENGATIAQCLRAFSQLQKRLSTPLLCMSYYNLLFRFPGNLQGFMKEAAEIGIQGLIVPDLPLDSKADQYVELAAKYQLLPVPIVTPLTTKARLTKIGHLVREGFVYCVSTTGTTGARKAFPPGLASYLRQVKQRVHLPQAVGFGISSPQHIRSLAGIADIAIVGSATIDVFRAHQGRNRFRAVEKFIKGLTQLCKD